MADRNVESDELGVPQIDETLVPCGAAMCLLCFATKGFPK